MRPAAARLALNARPSLLLAARAAGARPFAAGSVAAPRVQRLAQPRHVCEAASLQFIRGVDEPSVPEVSLKRARTGMSGQAVFIFENPSIFQASSELGDITGATAAVRQRAGRRGAHGRICCALCGAAR